VKDRPGPPQTLWVTLGVLLGVLGIWALLSSWRIYPESAFPSPGSVARAFVQEVRSGRLFDDAIASLYRVTMGFLIALVTSVPFGLWLGQQLRGHTGRAGRRTSPWGAGLLPYLNFFRFLSPLAWIPFSILWFGIGDPPAIFLIFMASFFVMALGVSAAVAGIPDVYFQVGRDYGIKGGELFRQVTLPAIMPQAITTVRLAAGVAWMVIVAAEMIGVREGMGYAIWDARNGLRNDLLVCAMLGIGAIGVGLDRLLMQLTRMKSVRWGYER
jgi:NitT/TauT family transport system permease protein